jgi:hypothetical protein
VKSRIAIWAVGGALAVGLWSIYFLADSRTPRGLVAIFLDLTCPIALARQHPLGIYIVLLANALTYALVGLVIETMRRPAGRPLKV